MDQLALVGGVTSAPNFGADVRACYHSGHRAGVAEQVSLSDHHRRKAKHDPRFGKLSLTTGNDDRHKALIKPPPAFLSSDHQISDHQIALQAIKGISIF